jgi:hypothetical protein
MRIFGEKRSKRKSHLCWYSLEACERSNDIGEKREITIDKKTIDNAGGRSGQFHEPDPHPQS